MLYNKTEKRVLQYVDALEKRIWRKLDCPLVVSAEQKKAYSEESLSPSRRIESYPYGFGSDNEDTVFTFTLDVPEVDSVYLSFPLGTDSLVKVNGKPECNVNPFHTVMDISSWRGQKASFEIKCWDGYKYPGWHPLNPSHLLTVTGRKQPDYPILLEQPEVLTKNPNQYALYHDLVVITETVLEENPESLFRQRVMARLHKALMGMSLVETDDAVSEAQAESVLETTREILQAKNGTIAPSVY
ncbi:MAG: hypothetical protein KBS81_09975, partial [Spirochaetales bacterium]|nr:hypothetical protein [Candidatus Physcosoma equi]